MKTKLLFTVMLSFSVIPGSAQIINVPTDQPTIQAGINAATTGDTVLVEEGVYYENIRFMGKAITLASHYIIDLDTTHIPSTIIDGSQSSNPDSAAVVMFLNKEDTTSILKGFTITGGTGVLSAFYNIRKGGGIYCNKAGAKITNNMIVENHLNHDNKAGGAGIGCERDDDDRWIIIQNNTISYNTTSTSGFSAYGAGVHASINTIIKDNTFEFNQCENTTTRGGTADGGAIEIEQYPGDHIKTEILNNIIRYNEIAGWDCYGAGVSIIFAEANITGNIVKFNSALAGDDGNGGGFWFDEPLESIKLSNNNISDNIITAAGYGRGAGVCIWNPHDKITLLNNKINHNESNADKCRGTGAFFRCNNYPVGKIEVRRNEFISNLGSMTATNCTGGGISLNDPKDTLVIFDSNRFEGNTAIYGGGIYARRSYNLQLRNNVFINNTSDYGGAFHFYHPAGGYSDLHPNVVNNTFCQNNSTYAAIYLNCESNLPVIFNNIFWENQSNGYSDLFNATGIDPITISYNNIDTNEVYGPWSGEENMNQDPLFDDPVNGDLHILPNSPCAAKGIDILNAFGVECYCPPMDFEGDLRPWPSAAMPDMGADEVNESSNGVEKFEVQNADFEIQGYPNPLNNRTTIRISLVRTQKVTLEICESNGIKIKTLFTGNLKAGEHAFYWDAQVLPEGVYYCVLKTNMTVQTKKLIKL